MADGAPPISREQLIARYGKGERIFAFADLQGADLSAYFQIPGVINR